MYQRYMCPSLGAIRRPLTHETALRSVSCARSFTISTRQSADDANSNRSSPSGTPKSPQTLRSRSNAAASKIADLPSGVQTPLRITRAPSGSAAGDRPTPQFARAPATLRITRTPVGTANGSLPPRQLVRAPATLRITRAPVGSGRSDGLPGQLGRGPNLQGRSGPPRPGPPRSGAGKRSPSGAKLAGQPKRRSKEQNESTREEHEQLVPGENLSDGMVQHLLRLQRKEWDRVPYEPIYSHGSKAAADLITAGKKLFEGEIPQEAKKPGRLERILGIAGRHGI
ncbi:hypothetical protein B0J11DRAFT_529868 [Dendryphion nanum]|uniref:Uncharacterized protein n=1 Tax=Dendryphion nanum TaxID=256645 RepID=A0A9P9DQY7_9PLEO|nr:hypothetical protein B0J11DRAFT_529868 [Dendryphion nanum]